MKIPISPPPIHTLFNELAETSESPTRLAEIMSSGISNLPKDQYIHWDKLRYLELPDGFTRNEWWLAIKMPRLSTFRKLPFLDKAGVPHNLTLPDFVLHKLHKIDRDAGGRIEVPEVVTNRQTRDRFLVRSLMEEAITSSQLEGASTTLKEAKAMLRENRKPINRSQRMILNNYHAMQFIRDNSKQAITRENILVLHEILTKDTLDDPTAVGRWRREDEDVKVVDNRDNTELHVPPNASEIENRIRTLCEFANEQESTQFIHPVVRAILVHFAIAYDHPFVDGNGRTARALFYWVMSRQGYWMMEFISISTILRKAPSKYARAYLYTETDNNDTTYFVDYQLDVIRRSITALHKYIARKSKEIRDADDWMRDSKHLRAILNYRQTAVLTHALKHPYEIYTVKSHMISHRIAYETARSDLLKLAENELLEKRTHGRAFEFSVPDDLRQKLNRLRQRR